MERYWTAEGGYNIRDLGGYPTQDGRKTRWNTLIRSGGLDKLTPEGQQRLLEYGVNTIIDLRDEWELEKYPNPFVESPHVKFANLPFIGKALAERADNDAQLEMHEYYIHYLAQCQAQIGAIITAIAENEGCTLFHCYAGKDRTGMVAALILSAVGVEDEVIAEDYALSESLIAHLSEQQRARVRARGEDPSRVDRTHASKAQTMLTMLDTLKEQYGGAVEYLTLCGVNRSQIEKIQERFVE